MKLFDVNIAVYAHRPDATPDHERYAAWLTHLVESETRFAFSELVLSAFVRIVTNRAIFRTPTPLGTALEFCGQLRVRSNAMSVSPGTQHWSIFDSLCRAAKAQGKLVADAYLAALAIENDCEWYSCDADFTRFPGLRWRHPLG